MNLAALQNVPQARKNRVAVGEAVCESFEVPIRFDGTCRELPASPGRFLSLLRQRQGKWINRSWRWGSSVAQL